MLMALFLLHLTNNILSGWDTGLVGIKVGGERVLTIPPAAGYGKRGSPPEIPPNSTLVFGVFCSPFPSARSDWYCRGQMSFDQVMTRCYTRHCKSITV